MMNILVVEDEKTQQEILKGFLRKKGYNVVGFSCGEKALEYIKKEVVNLVISDLRLPGISGMELLKSVKEVKPEVDFIMVTAYGTVENAVEAMKSGAYDYLLKPINLEELLVKIKKIEEKKKLEEEIQDLKEELEKYPDIVAESAKMKKVLSLALKVAPTPTTVLLTGESGTGKEVLARFIHKESRRRGRFVAVSCAAIPETLLEAELFGYEKGAFTGAAREKPGKFELANGGTIFLDEIGDMPFSLQVKLLRVLQEKEVERIGAISPRKVDVRIIAATNRNLEEKVRMGEFREDLFYRLNVFHIHIPPLRERPRDILPLAELFLRKYSLELSKKIKDFSPGAKRILVSYRWPGNVRELENVVERACVLCDSEFIERKHIMIGFKEEKELLKLEDVEREHIKRVMEMVNWNITKGAEILGIHRNTLSKKIKEYFGRH